MGEYVQPQVDTSIKSGSFAFFLAIPCTFGLGSAAVTAFLPDLLKQNFNHERLILAAYAFIVAIVIFSSRRLTTLRTFLHELKHAIVVLLSGNRVRDLKVHSRQGHVSYLMYSDRTRFAPFIMLAPYFFPLLSFPVLGFALVSDNDPQHLVACVLAGLLAADLTCAYKDYHPAQSDLQRISGGWIPVLVFILSVNFMWSSFCVLWLLLGRSGFIFAGQILVDQAELFLKYAQGLL